MTTKRRLLFTIFLAYCTSVWTVHGFFIVHVKQDAHSSRLLPILSAKKKTQRAKPNHSDKWQPHFDELQKYKDIHGDCNISESSLADWLQDQRKQYRFLMEGKKVRLTRKRAAALERIGAVDSEYEPAPAATEELKEEREGDNTRINNQQAL